MTDNVTGLITILGSLDWPSIIAAIIIAIILFVGALFRRWLVRKWRELITMVGERNRMHNDKKMWKKYGIIANVRGTPTLYVDVNGDAYTVSMSLNIDYQTLDDRNDTMINEDPILYVKGEDIGREPYHHGKTYTLLCSNRASLDRLIIPRAGTHPRTYTFSGDFNIRPVFKDKTRCDVQLGNADIQGVLYAYPFGISKRKVNVERRKDDAQTYLSKNDIPIS